MMLATKVMCNHKVQRWLTADVSGLWRKPTVCRRPDTVRRSGEEGISSWGWNLNGQHSTSHALFPRAWTVYDGQPDPDLKISCRQISPFIPHNYRNSSLPTAVFVYTLVNTGKERAKVSLLFTWANSIEGDSHLYGNHVNEPFIGEDGVSGVLLHHKSAKGNPPVTSAIAACETQNVCDCVAMFWPL